MKISLSGKKRCGKDTVFGFLQDFVEVKRMAFADPLKEACSIAFDIDKKFFYDDDLKDKDFDVPFVLSCERLRKLAMVLDFRPTEDYYSVGAFKEMKTPRQLLQFVGTDLVRKTIKDSFWLDLLELKLKDSSDYLVLTDSRFKNERDMLKRAGAILVLIKRDIGNEDCHASENDLGLESDYDIVIENNGSLDELKSQVVEIFGL